MTAKLRSRFVLPFLLLATSVVACAEPAPEEVGSQADAYSGNQSERGATTGIDRPELAPEGFYPSENVGGYYGPCGPLSATWLMTWYVGRGPGGAGTNQKTYDKVSDWAQGDRIAPGSSPSGLAYAINRTLGNGFYKGLGRSRTGASIEDIRGLVDTRRPVIVLIQWKDPGNTFPTLHYVTVFGYEKSGDSFAYLIHDNGSFAKIEESVLESGRDTSFYNRGIVWIDRALPTALPAP